MNLLTQLRKSDDNIKRIDVGKVSCDQFLEQFEKLKKPVVITNSQTDWKAKESWSLDTLKEKYGEEKFHTATTDPMITEPKTIKNYIKNKNRKDVSPSFIFHDLDEQTELKKQLLNDYTVPKYFEGDLFKYSSFPYRWFEIGTALSGLGISTEPLNTSLWTALVAGQKRWCLFPSPEQTFVSLLWDEDDEEKRKQQKEAVTWFKTIYQKTKKPEWPKQLKPIEILQNPGETVFVPLGYWYVVINLDDTIAVTHKFCSEINFASIWNCTVRFKNTSTLWSEGLRTHLPDVAAKFQEIINDSCSRSTSEISVGELDLTEPEKIWRKNVNELCAMMAKLCNRTDTTYVVEFSDNVVEFSKKIETFRQNIVAIQLPPKKRYISQARLEILKKFRMFDVYSKPTFGLFKQSKANEFDREMHNILTDIYSILRE